MTHPADLIVRLGLWIRRQQLLTIWTEDELNDYS